MPIERLLLPATGRGRRRLSAAVVAGVLAGGLVVVQAWLLAAAIDALFLRRAAIGRVLPLLCALAVVALLRAAAAWAADVSAAGAAADVRVALRARVVSSLLGRGPRFTSRERTGELVGTLVGGIEATDAYVGRYLPHLALAALVPLIAGGAVLAADPLSALVLALTYPLIPMFMALTADAARTRSRRQWVTLSRLGARFLDAIQGIETLKTLGRTRDVAESIADAGDRFRVVTFGVLRVAFLSALTLELVATLGTAIVAVGIGLRLLRGSIAFREAMFVLVVVPEFYRPLRALGAAFHAGTTAKEASARLADLIDPPPPRPERRAPLPPAAPAAPALWCGPLPAARIAFRNVSLRYGSRRLPALDDVSFDIEAGTTVALIGPTGAGKSSIAHLLLRLIEPTSGRILVGGTPLDTIDPEAWRARVAWVPQRPHLFHGSLLDNVRLARPGATGTEIERALALAHVDEFVPALPQGLDTPVGERGERLSGGQARRVALARAFLRDVPHLVLDEPTSHLDPDNEAAVMDALGVLCRGRTVLLVTHVLTTTALADHVVVLSGGRLAEQGPHDLLVAGGGVYQRMWSAWTDAS